MKHNIYKTINKQNVKNASNRQIKMFINNIVIPVLKEKYSKKEINNIIGRSNTERIEKARNGLYEKLEF